MLYGRSERCLYWREDVDHSLYVELCQFLDNLPKIILHLGSPWDEVSIFQIVPRVMPNSITGYSNDESLGFGRHAEL